MPLPGGAPEAYPTAAVEHARRTTATAPYAPFSLAILSPHGSWLVVHDGHESSALGPLEPGWHVLTHTELDDRGEPRTARLLDRLASGTPAAPPEAEATLESLLRLHAGETKAEPAVCIHEGPMVTVSSSIVVLGLAEPRYLHAEGRPCEGPYEDRSALLAQRAAR